ncbi:MAG: type II toxin-antitoxin system RelE/ParE family toxin [Ferruginibacter sp.]
MGYNYKFHELAQKDYEVSLQWYLERSIRAAQNFVAAMDGALQLIVEYPTWWLNKYKDYHEISLKKYPFTIIYKIEEEKQLIIILSIYHHKRNPKRKYRK